MCSLFVVKTDFSFKIRDAMCDFQQEEKIFFYFNSLVTYIKENETDFKIGKLYSRILNDKDLVNNLISYHLDLAMLEKV